VHLSRRINNFKKVISITYFALLIIKIHSAASYSYRESNLFCVFCYFVVLLLLVLLLLFLLLGFGVLCCFYCCLNYLHRFPFVIVEILAVVGRLVGVGVGVIG